MKIRGDSWAGKMTDDQVEEAYGLAIKAVPRHVAIPQIVAAFNLPTAPSRTAFYNWLEKVEKDSWRWRLKHAVSVAKTMEQALPDDADALYRNSLVALGVDAAVQQDPKFAIAIGRTITAMNKDRESRLRQQIQQLKDRMAQLLDASQKAAAPLDPARVAAEIDEVLGRRTAKGAA